MEANTPNRMENHRKKSKQKVYVLTTGITAVWEVMQGNFVIREDEIKEKQCEDSVESDDKGVMSYT